MSEERQRILRMLKEGKLTVDEAEALLEAIGEEMYPAEAGAPSAEAPGAPDGEWETPAEELHRRDVDADRLVDAAERAEPGAAAPGTAPTGEEPGEREVRRRERRARDRERDARDRERGAHRQEWRDLVDEIIASVDVEGIVESVRESIKDVRPDVDRLKEGIREEVRRATEHAREEARRAADEARRAARAWRGARGFVRVPKPPVPPRPPKPPKFGFAIARAIEGLWGLTDATGEWTRETELAPGTRLVLRNTWGDVTLRPSPDARLRVRAETRAWGRDRQDAQEHLDRITIDARAEGETFVLAVGRSDGERGRFRVDFEIDVPAGIAVDVTESKGDIEAARIEGDVSVQTRSGDVSVMHGRGATRLRVGSGDVTVSHREGEASVETRSGDISLTDIGGPVRVATARGEVSGERLRGDVHIATQAGDISLVEVAGNVSLATHGGDVTAERVEGDLAAASSGGDVSVASIGGSVRVGTQGGDVSLERVAGRIHAHTQGADISLAAPAGPIAFTLSTHGGDVSVEVGELVPGSESTAATSAGDVSVSLGPRARCRVRARSINGEISASGAFSEVQRTKRTFEAVLGTPDATLELSTASGDVSIEGGQ